MDRLYLPFYRALMAREPQLTAVLDTVERWQPNALLPCHGVYQAA